MTEKRGERQRQRDNKRQKQRKRESSIHWYAPQCPQQAGMGQFPARRQKLHSDLPCGWQELQYLRHHFLPLRHISKKIIRSDTAGTRHTDNGSQTQKHSLTLWAQIQ